MRYWKEWKSYEETKAMVYQEEKRGKKKQAARAIPEASLISVRQKQKQSARAIPEPSLISVLTLTMTSWDPRASAASPSAPSARYKPGDRSTWLCSSALIPAAQRPLHIPNHCPIGCEDIQASTVDALISHLRHMHKPGVTTSSTFPARTSLPGLTACLSSHGYWYCQSHRKYLASTVGRPLPNGLRPFSYKRCTLCACDTRPSRYIPLLPNQLKTVTHCSNTISRTQQPLTNEAARPAPSVAPVPIQESAALENHPRSQSIQEAVPAPDVAPPTAVTGMNEEEIPQGHASPQPPRQPMPSLKEICTTHIPMVAHIPSRVRPVFADALSRVVWDAAKAPVNSAESLEAFTRLLFFPAALLSNPKTHPSISSVGTASNYSIFRERLALWDSGQFGTLWTAAQQSSTSRPSQATAKDRQAQINAKRAVRLAQEGAYGKAALALQSDGLAGSSTDVTTELLAKHPQSTPAEDSNQYATPTSLPTVIPLTKEQVLKGIRRFPPASAAGGSGLRPSHLEELVGVPNTNEATGLLPGLTKLVNLLASGRGPTSIALWFSGAPLTALAKPDGGVRPIAVGETLRRLVSSCLFARISSEAREFFQPLQLGIATSAGTETIVHSARRTVQKFGENCNYAMLSVDMKNAFNLVSRKAFLREVEKNFPQLLPWVDYCYANENAYLWTGEEELRSVTGVQQGDPLGPFLFSLVLHPLASELSTIMHSADTNDQQTPPVLLHTWYLDDGIIIAKHEALVRALSFLDSARAKQNGLYLCASKCRIWWPSEPPRELQSIYPANVPRDHGAGTQVLKAPIGRDSFVAESFFQHVMSLKPLFGELEALEDFHVAFQLLKTCMGVCKVTYFLRVLPPAETQRGSTLFDNMVESCLRAMLGGVLDQSVFRELQLPMRMKNGSPSFGMGLTSAVSTAAAAHLASASLTHKLCTTVTRISGSLPTALSADQAAVDAHTRWTEQVDPTAVIPLTRLDGETPLSQNAMVASVNEWTLAQLPSGDDRTKAFRATLSTPGAKTWLQCTPTPGMRTYIADRDFRIWMQYYCRISLYEAGTPCPRRGCKHTMDHYGDHLLYCPNGSPRGWRHNSQVRLLASDLTKAVRSPVMEPPQPRHRVRPDIKALGTHGGTDFFDVTFVHPLTPARIPTLPQCPLRPLNQAKNVKERRFARLVQDTGPGTRLVPIPMSTLGGWHPEAHAFMCSLADSVASRAIVERRVARQALFRRHAARLVQTNANCLLEGIFVSI